MDKYPTMEEMIESCKKKQTENEIIAFALGVGRLIPKLGKRKQMKAAMDWIKQSEGFLGIHPIDVWHNLLIYDTLNNAKGARNILRAYGSDDAVGNIAPILIPKEFVNGGK